MDAIFTEMPDDIASEAARRGLELLTELSPDLRGAVVLDGAGEVLACSGDGARWGSGATSLFAAAERRGGGQAEAVHVGTERGEVFGVRHDRLLAVAVTERFALASLTLFDLRSMLREVAAAGEAEAA